MYNTGGESRTKYKIARKFESKGGGGLPIDCYQVPRIMQVSHGFELDGPTLLALQEYLLNEPVSARGGQLDLLIGVPVLWKIIRGIHARISDSLVLLDTIYGNVICGSASGVGQTVEARAATVEDLNKRVEKLWQLDSFPRDDSESKLTMDEIAAVESMEKNLKFDKSIGRFQTRLLWKGKPDLVNNYAAAKARLDGLMRRLRKDPQVKAAYKSVISEFIDQATVELVTWETLAQMQEASRVDLYFLPHRAVYDPGRVSTKCRVVMDASAKTATGKSLNDCLLPGPPLQQQIAAVELRFRRRKIALIGDCKKMFLQVIVHPDDRPFLRFLWHDPDDIHAVPKVYQFRTLIFGAADSPFQAISCFQRLVADRRRRGNLSSLEERVCETILRDTYVDDITTGGDSVNDAFDMYKGLNKLLGSAHFKIHKWATNSPELLKRIPEEERAPATENEDFDWLESDETSSLGIRWDPRTDLFIFRRYVSIGQFNDDTKTAVASLLARPFDPLGLISPFILLARKILKQTFEENLGWKDKLTGEMLESWQRWLSYLPDLEKVTFPRHVPFTPDTEIHVFGDAAANMGHGVAAYARTPVGNNGKFETHLLFAKSRINPKRDITVPRLELVASLLCAQTAEMLHKELGVARDKIYCYSDSETALWWLTKPPSALLPFVSNRVQKIIELGYRFNYVNTAANPADVASRGCTPDELLCTLWQKGPKFLSLPNSEWTPPKIDFSKVDKLQEVKKANVYNYSSFVKRIGRGANRKIVNLEDCYGDHDELLRRIAILKSVVVFWRDKTKGKVRGHYDKLLASSHIHFARKYWIKQSQGKEFPAELAALQKGQPIPTGSRLLPLNPQLDDDGIMRVHGRVVESKISPEQRYPIILPKNHTFTSSLIKKVHDENSHAPVDWLHFHIRQQFWILSSRQLIRSVLRKCFECQKANARRGQQMMAPLPANRVNFEPPFSRVGVDYTAKFSIKSTYRGSTPYPCYLVIFTCFVTRAVHLEIVLSDEAEGFLMALKRMISARGHPQHMYSDNAKYFIRADKEIAETIDKNNEIIKDFSEQLRFHWHYSVEYHSSGGGVWERMVKAIKVPLRKVLGDSLLTYVELLTVVKEIEAQVNDRPLVQASEDTFKVITPSMLCLGRRIKLWPDFFAETDLRQESSVRLRWEVRKELVTKFRELWLKQYLPQLQERQRWRTKEPNLKIGDLVLLETENKKQFRWPVARVNKIMRGKDGLVRTVLVRTKTSRGLLRRGIHEIFPLESCRE